jgi:hypothetical protein
MIEMTNTNEALKALDRIYGIRAESTGVYGFHRNGDIAAWDYFDFDGDYETIRAALTANTLPTSSENVSNAPPKPYKNTEKRND